MGFIISFVVVLLVVVVVKPLVSLLGKLRKDILFQDAK